MARGSVSIDNYPAYKLAQKCQVTASYVYFAEAAPGSLEASAVWRVQRISLVSPFTNTWADGDANFDNTANNLTTLTYS
jgi:hypothetical protein